MAPSRFGTYERITAVLRMHLSLITQFHIQITGPQGSMVRLSYLLQFFFIAKMLFCLIQSFLYIFFFFIESFLQTCFEGKWLQIRLRADEDELRSLSAVDIQGHQNRDQGRGRYLRWCSISTLVFDIYVGVRYLRWCSISTLVFDIYLDIYLFI